ncbi:hypothetical protein EDB19DRAFT_1824226 [Suillus lakei]|nr:hypothetical protein EDB19DRAFT_1824226 [Suillus lakei]
MYESVTTDRRVCKKFNLLYGTLSLIHGIQSHHITLSHSRILTMPPNRRCNFQKKAEDDATREAKFAAAIQAIKEKKTKNLWTAAAQFKVPYDTLCRQALNLTKPHSKAHKNQQLLTEGQEETLCHWAQYLAMTGHPLSKRSLRAKVSAE